MPETSEDAAVASMLAEFIAALDERDRRMYKLGASDSAAEIDRLRSILSDLDVTLGRDKRCDETIREAAERVADSASTAIADADALARECREWRDIGSERPRKLTEFEWIQLNNACNAANPALRRVADRHKARKGGL